MVLPWYGEILTIYTLIFAGTCFRGELSSRTTRVKIRFHGYLFLRMGRILVLFIYFAHVSFWTIFREAPVSVQYRGYLFSRMAGNFAKL